MSTSLVQNSSISMCWLSAAAGGGAPGRLPPLSGGGGGGCAAAITAAQRGAQVILASKLRLGDSNTVMAEGGIQAAIGEDDSPQLHFEDTMRAGHFCGDPELVAQMVMDGPDVIRWMIQLGMMFDLEDDRTIGGNLLRKKPG